MRCSECAGNCFRPECVPYHVEDRRHMARERGDGWSYSLGAPMPQSRSEQRRIEKQKGVYFDSGPTQQEKRYIEYAKHCKETGDTPNPKMFDAPVPSSKNDIKDNIVKAWKKHGVVTD